MKNLIQFLVPIPRPPFVSLSDCISKQVSIFQVQEMALTRHRDVIGCVMAICMSSGYMLMPLIAYLVDDWRWVVRWPGLLCLPLMSYYWYILPGISNPVEYQKSYFLFGPKFYSGISVVAAVARTRKGSQFNIEKALF